MLFYANLVPFLDVWVGQFLTDQFIQDYTKGINVTLECVWIRILHAYNLRSLQYKIISVIIYIFIGTHAYMQGHT